MAALHFAKWEGTGNDFILVDDRLATFPAADVRVIQRLCDRHFGIGSDGLILLQPARKAGAAYHMEFHNPDASKSFCGNGSRCAFAFWCALTGTRAPLRFSAIDGEHSAEWRGSEVAISLLPVEGLSRESEEVDFVHNGSPHEIVQVEDPDKVDVVMEGRRRRHDPKRGNAGANVNFLSVANGIVHMRTYERGVEDETLSCGTGVVAAALSALSRGRSRTPVTVIARGGTLTVEAEPTDRGGWDHIRLIGPVRHVFDGSLDLTTMDRS